MTIYILTSHRLKKGKLLKPYGPSRVSLISASTVPHRRYVDISYQRTGKLTKTSMIKAAAR